MARPKNKQADESTQDNDPFPGELPPAELTQTDPQGGHAAQVKKKKFEPVRGWHSERRGTLDFRKLTDFDRKIIFFQFAQKPDEETLAIMKSDEMKQAGVKFEDSRQHGKIWVIPNDEEGRITADKLAYRLTQLAQQRAEAAKNSSPQVG